MSEGKEVTVKTCLETPCEHKSVKTTMQHMDKPTTSKIDAAYTKSIDPTQQSQKSGNTSRQAPKMKSKP